MSLWSTLPSGHFILYNGSVKQVLLLLPRATGSMDHPAVRKTQNLSLVLALKLPGRPWAGKAVGVTAMASREHYLPAPPMNRSHPPRKPLAWSAPRAEPAPKRGTQGRFTPSVAPEPGLRVTPLTRRHLSSYWTAQPVGSLAALAAPGRLVAPSLTSSHGAATRSRARATKMSPTPALFSLPEARTRFTVSLGAGVCRSNPALLFLFLSLKICQRPEDLCRSVRSWPLPRPTVRERRISYLFGSRNPVLFVGQRGAFTHRLALSAPAAWSRCLGQEPWSLCSRSASYTTRCLIWQPVHASLTLFISSRGGYGAPKREDANWSPWEGLQAGNSHQPQFRSCLFGKG